MNPSSSSSSTPQDWHRLFAAKADGTISPEDHEILSNLLKESAEARREWFRFQDAESALLAWSQRETLRIEEGVGMAALLEKENDNEQTAIIRPSSSTRWKYAGAVAAGVVIGFVAWSFRPPAVPPTAVPVAANTNSAPTPATTPAPANVTAPVVAVAAETDAAARDEARTSSVAVLSRGVNLEWDRAVASPAVNAPLPPGVLRLKSGVAEIEFFEGARLCVEGPAEIRLVSAGEAYCSYGRFSAHVPPQARGFKLGTPKGEIVDLGTDFGLDLNETSPELHVFKGEVELHQPKTEMRTLTTGAAAGLEQAGSTRPLVANAAAFTFSHDLDERVAASGKESFDRWLTSSSLWNADENLRLRFDFQEASTARSVRNLALHGQGISAGTVVGCSRTQGRWPEKNALQFRSVSDRVRINVPGEYRDLTLSAWVQLHSLNVRQSQSSICMSQGIEAGGVHWQVLYNGSICLGIVASSHPSVTDDYISPVVFTPDRFGQWIHLAAVLDSAAHEVRLYVNGERISQHSLKRETLAKPALAELGNWMPSTDYRGSQAVRNFVGCMDEFSLTARALTDEEIHQLAD